MNLNESLEIYLKYIKFEKNLSSNTITSYKNDISQFINFLRDTKKNNVLKNDETDRFINLVNFRDFLKFISNFNYSNKTLIRKYSSLQNYFKFLETGKYIKFPLSHFIASPKKHHNLFTFLSQTEMQQLINSIDTSNYSGIRNRTIIEMFYSTGARISEIESIQVKDIDFEKREIKVFGKGRKYRVVFLNSSSIFWINKYLPLREKIINELFLKQENRKIKKHYIKNSDEYKNSLFINKYGYRLSQRSIRNIIRYQLKIAKIDKNISPHKIRHTFATHLLQEGAGIREIQMLLGHENVSTTQIYTHLNIKKLKSDFNKFHPRAK